MWFALTGLATLALALRPFRPEDGGAPEAS